MDADVIVVGAGPAGASAAYELARRGVRVILIEQKRLPRYKPCGGCLSLKIDTILEDDFHPLIERTIHGARFTFKGLDEIRVRSEEPVAYMVMRDRFDHFLAMKAQAAGATLVTGERVGEVAESADGVTVRTDRRELRASFLVGADGANGVVGRRLQLTPRRRVAVCVEAEVTQASSVPAAVADDEVAIEFGSIPFGYGWIFPKGDHLSIGVGGLRDKVQNPRQLYDEFLVDQDLVDDLTSERRKGYIIPVFAGGADPIAAGRSLLVGDAAALVDPFLGEGVYYAVRSGQLAAQALAAACRGDRRSPADAYQGGVAAEIYPEFRAARKVAFFVYLFPRLAYGVLRRARHHFVERYFDVLRGDAGYADLWSTLRGESVSSLVRTLWPDRLPSVGVAEHYDRMARQYADALPVWRAMVAGPALAAFGDLVEQHVRPGAVVLDAGTGTGAAVRQLLERSDPGSVTAIDLSRGMLREARKRVKDPRITWAQQDIVALPYADRSFDVVISTWVLESVDDPRRVITELLRVLRDDGFLVYAFSSLPEASRLRRLYARLIEEWSAGNLHGRFVPVADRPFHDCEHSRLLTFAGGMATVVVLRKCCTVDGGEGACPPAITSAGRLRQAPHTGQDAP
ncbi:MAG: geranylgeranyl reductase family protein [Gemmatimonadales bacterium]